MKSTMRGLGAAAREAARVLARADTQTKNRALQSMADAIRARQAELLAANRGDVEQATRDGRDAAFVDRLTLTPQLVEQMAAGLEQVAALPDPVGQVSERVRRPTGIEVARMRVPIGV
ncbi:MAG TPA: gamma-glutamyl-phosphate reductase, partial [Burkholderiales bacterium]|nr:gamma-glutamyl-phosphate reductase [Burkholderiales bacterium]